jgi:hypothetical protein
VRRLYKVMKFRTYFADQPVSLPSFSLKEGDLLGTPSSGASTSAGESPLSKTPWVNPSREAQGDSGDQPEHGGQSLGSGRPPDAMDTQLRQAGTMATELLKALTTLPHPWNKNFHPYIRALQGLVEKIGMLS